MSIQISGTDVVNNSRKGIFTSMNPGVASSPPASPSTGDIYYNSTSKQIFAYDGTSWIAQN
jgi:hypothetical protein